MQFWCVVAKKEVYKFLDQTWSNCQFIGVLFQSPPFLGGKDGEKPTESMWGIGAESNLGKILDYRTFFP